MARYNILTAKTQFSALVHKVQAGGEVIILRGDVPVARLVPYDAPAGPRQFGALKGLVRVSDTFFDPLPDDELDAWGE